MEAEPISDPLCSDPPGPLSGRLAHVQLNALNTIVIPHDPRSTSTRDWFATHNDPPTQAAPAVTEGNEVMYLVDGPAAFREFAAAMSRARGNESFIYILGWWMDETVELIPGCKLEQLLLDAAASGAEIRAMLSWVPNADRNSQACSLVRALPHADAILDSRTLLRGTHHQKVLVVRAGDEILAFCGGVDMNRDRVEGNPETGAPLHDVHCRIRGPAAKELLKVFCERWDDYINAADKKPGSDDRLYARDLRGRAEPTPRTHGALTVQVARTYGNSSAFKYHFARDGDRSIRRMLESAIKTARRFIYIEDQYLFDPSISKLLGERLGHLEHLTILIPRDEFAAPIQTLAGTVQNEFAHRRSLFLDPLLQNGRKVRVFSLKGSYHAYVHAKTWIFDDRFAVIGSANVNRRGMTHDSEVAAGVFDPSTDDALTYRFAHRLRIKLWAEHLGLDDPEGHAELADGAAAAVLWLPKWRPEGARIENYESTFRGVVSDNKTAARHGVGLADYAWEILGDPDGS